MGKTISELIEKMSASDSDVLLIENTTSTNKITKANLLKEITQELSYSNGSSEGNYITVTGTKDGSVTDLEILGNTVQSSANLADIQSVGTLQEDGRYKMSILSCGKNLIDVSKVVNGKYISVIDGILIESHSSRSYFDFVKVKNNTPYILNHVGTHTDWYIFFYDCNRNHLSNIYHATGKSFNIATPNNCCYIRIQSVSNAGNISATSKLQLEEGTTPTSYEPYQYNKSSILLPCQLEKVGTVSDRLFRREDGVWCVEKNIGEVTLNGSEVWSLDSNNVLYISSSSWKGLAHKTSITCISNKYGQGSSTSDIVDKMFMGNSYLFMIKPTGFSTTTEWSNHLKSNPLNVKYALATPQIIELPLDTQIQLNSFNGTTNIFTEDTVIEPTIKATVPKSLGASVQSLNNKTDNLSQRVEAVEQLKEGQELSVSTENGHVCVEDTNNGYVKDLKVEGNTLVNLFDGVAYGGYNFEYGLGAFYLNERLKKSTGKITIIISTGTQSTTNLKWALYRRTASTHLNNGAYVEYNQKFNTPILIDLSKDTFDQSTFDFYALFMSNHNGASYEKIDSSQVKVIVLEGDHTQNPPAYFEGIKSVGDNTDKIEILSRKEDGNLFDGELETGTLGTSGEFVVSTARKVSKYIEVLPNTPLYTNAEVVCFYDINSTFIGRVSEVTTFTTPSNCRYIRFRTHNMGTDSYLNNYYVSKFITTYEHHQNKKQLLYQNSEGDFIKPILRKVGNVADSIELHSDGKYYFHKRCGEVVLNGSESWSTHTTNTNTITVQLSFKESMPPANNIKGFVCDKIPCITRNEFVANKDVFSVSQNIYGSSGFIIISIEKTKLSSQDLAGFKKWLSENPTTVVYQLATEEVYPSNNLDLNSYKGETSIRIGSGNIIPKLSFNVTSHIGNIVAKMKDDVDRNTKFREELTESVTISKEFENGYQLVEDTKEGNVRVDLMEGKTLVNIFDYSKAVTIGTAGTTKEGDKGFKLVQEGTSEEVRLESSLIKPSTTYTLIYEVTESTLAPTSFCIKGSSAYIIPVNIALPTTIGFNMVTFTTSNTPTTRIGFGIGGTSVDGTYIVFKKVRLLEGDFTSNPPSYFEGLKSVGDGTDKIEVLSSGSVIYEKSFSVGGMNKGEVITAQNTRLHTPTYYMTNLDSFVISIDKNFSVEICMYDKNKTYISNLYWKNNGDVILLDSACKYVRFAFKHTSEKLLTSKDLSSFKFIGSPNKKQILYLNSEGNYEKPILRSVGSVKDSIEKHSDGKYYFHKRCGEVVLNGSESWSDYSVTYSNSIWFTMVHSYSKPKSIVMCDKYNYVSETGDFEGVLRGASSIAIGTLKSKLSTQDLAGFKTWLQSNPVTVVYQLATEEVYECANLDLDSYEGKTSVIFDSGVISPKVSVRLSSRLAQTVQVLKDRINYLEDKMINMFKSVLSGDVQSLAYELYPEDFEE